MGIFVALSKKSEVLYRSVVAVRCFFLCVGGCLIKSVNRRQRRSRNALNYIQPQSCDEAERGARGSGGASSPGCGKRGAIPVPLSPEKAEEGAELRHITTKQATNTPTRPPKQTRGSGRRGAMFFAWLRWQRIYVQGGASLPDQAATTERRDTSPLRRKERREPPCKKKPESQKRA